MKLKYYMRGLGIGIILTTLVFLVTKPEQELTDDEIRSRAAELGMTMEKDPLSSSLNDILQKSDEKDSKDSDTNNKDSMDSDASGDMPSSSDSNEADEEKSNEEDAEVDQNKLDQDTTDDNETDINKTDDNETDNNTDSNVQSPLEDGNSDDNSTQTSEVEELDTSNQEPHIFTITEGLSSGTVSKRLQEAGIIKSAKKFNQYMIKIKKVTSIRVGTYELPRNASYDEIAKIITKQR